MNIRANELFTNENSLFQNIGINGLQQEQIINDEKINDERKSIFIGQKNDDKAYQIRKEAVRQALKQKLSAHEGELDIDNTIDQLDARNEELSTYINNAQREIAVLDENIEAAAANGVSSEEYDVQKTEWKKIITSGTAEMEGNRKSVIAISNERVKSQAMVNANKAADKIMLSAAKETVSTLFSDAIQDVQDKFEKTIEQAKEKAGKKAEEEERIKKAQEENESIKESNGDASTREVEDAVDDALTVEARNMIKEQKILDEDILGLLVDEIR